MCKQDDDLLIGGCGIRRDARRSQIGNNGMKKVGIIENHLKARDNMRDSYRYEIYNYENEESEQS